MSIDQHIVNGSIESGREGDVAKAIKEYLKDKQLGPKEREQIEKVIDAMNTSKEQIIQDAKNKLKGFLAKAQGGPEFEEFKKKILAKMASAEASAVAPAPVVVAPPPVVVAPAPQEIAKNKINGQIQKGKAIS